MKTAVHLTDLGGGSVLREVVDEAEHVLHAETLSRRQAEAAGLARPKPRQRKPRLTARRALLRLLVARQGEVITRADIEAELGRSVDRRTVWAAARRLGADLPMIGVRGPGGGYVLCTQAREEVEP